jgi:hypothetical protein
MSKNIEFSIDHFCCLFPPVLHPMREAFTDIEVTIAGDKMEKLGLSSSPLRREGSVSYQNCSDIHSGFYATILGTAISNRLLRHIRLF